MESRKPHPAVVVLFVLLYPAASFGVRYLPNPMVPDAIIALNMIIPALAGFFFGPLTGLVCGGLGTAIAAVVQWDPFYALAIVPHAIMGAAAGWLGRRGNEFLASLSLAVGHALNVCVFLVFGLLRLGEENLNNTVLGLASEVSINIVAFILVAAFLKHTLFSSRRI